MLRDFESEDFEPFYATTNDPEYQKYYCRREMTREFWKDLFERILPSSGEERRMSYQLAVCLKTGELIGTCGVRIEAPDHQQASFGCAIARDYWGKGYAIEAAHGIINFGFSSLPIRRIYAETISENTRARALAARIGMRLEGELKYHKFFRGRWWNTVIYAILKDEWDLSAA